MSAKVFDIVDNKFYVINKRECQFRYRNSIFKKYKNKYIILSVKLKLQKKANAVLTSKPLDSLKGTGSSIKEIRDILNKKNYTKYLRLG